MASMYSWHTQFLQEISLAALNARTARQRKALELWWSREQLLLQVRYLHIFCCWQSMEFKILKRMWSQRITGFNLEQSFLSFKDRGGSALS